MWFSTLGVTCHGSMQHGHALISPGKLHLINMFTCVIQTKPKSYVTNVAVTHLILPDWHPFLQTPWCWLSAASTWPNFTLALWPEVRTSSVEFTRLALPSGDRQPNSDRPASAAQNHPNGSCNDNIQSHSDRMHQASQSAQAARDHCSPFTQCYDLNWINIRSK